MTVFIRVDASIEIGTGHVMRCLTLAHQLRKNSKEVIFICRVSQGDCIQLIRNQGFTVYELPKVQKSLWKYTADNWSVDANQTIHILQNFEVEKLVIDHYSIDIKWETLVRPIVREIMVIDDLANRQHDCDVLLDQNYSLDMNLRYKNLLPREATLLLGPKYALLREEFYEAKKFIAPFNGKVKRLFIFFGGSDPTNETEKVLHAIKPLIQRYHLHVDVVVGNSNPNKNKIQDICNEIKGTHYYCQINNMAELMAKADLAIGAGGATTWERAFLKLPSIVIAVAENQINIAKASQQKGLCIYLGFYNEVSVCEIENTLEKTFNSSSKINKMINDMETFFE